MTNDELKNIWAQQGTGERSIPIGPGAIWQLARTSERFERAIFWRDAREWTATILVAGFFLFFGFSQPTIHWLLIAAAIVVCGPMTYVAIIRRKRPVAEASQSLIDHLRESIASVRHQTRLLRSVFWWYLAPIAVGLLLIHIDFTRSGRVHYDGRWMLGALVSVAVFFGIWKLNQRAVCTDLEPRIRELEKALAELAA